jgi:hypothetical protein
MLTHEFPPDITISKIVRFPVLDSKRDTPCESDLRDDDTRVNFELSAQIPADLQRKEHVGYRVISFSRA